MNTHLPAMVPVESSNIQAIGHDAQGLVVQFKGGGLYRYAGCSAQIFREGLLHKSPGSWFRESVKDKFPHEKLQ